MKKLILAVILIGLIAGPAMGQSNFPPPAYGGYQAGWGMNPNMWNNHTGSYSEWGIYDPLYGGAGDAWVVGYTDPNGNTPVYITYAPITLELWIEMYMLLTYEYTSYQWHRVGDELACTVIFTISGTIQSNSGQWIGLIAGQEPMTHLIFREDIFGRTGPTYGRNIPITWEGRWGTGLTVGQNVSLGWHYLYPEPDIYLLIDERCDHWFEFRGAFCVEYHENDGYYSLELAGCPAPTL